MINKLTPFHPAENFKGISEGNAEGFQVPQPVSLEARWMKKSNIAMTGEAISPNELTSISALIAYVSHRTDFSEFRTERELSDRFNVPNITCLPAAAYDEAIRFLVDRVPQNIRGF